MNMAFWKDMNASIAASGDRLLSWWIGELAWFVPVRWRIKKQAKLEARQDGNEFNLTFIRPPSVVKEGRLSQGRVEPADLFSDRTVRTADVPVWLFPSEEVILSRCIQIPASAAARFENLLGLEIDRWSPYRLDEVYVAWTELNTDSPARRDIDLRLIPRVLVESLRADLAAAQLAPSFLALGPARRHQIDLRPVSGRLLSVKTVPILISVVLIAALLATDWLAATRELTLWRERYRTEVKSFASQRNIEERISKAIMTIEQTGNSSSKGKVLAGLSSAIPDTDWLTEITIKNENLTLRGYATDLDRLIKALEPLAVDRSITLQGEVAFDSSTNRQRFTIVFRPNGA